MWPIEGPFLLGALSMNVSRCRFYLHDTLAPGPAPSYTLKGEPAAGICGPCLELFACLSRAFCLSLELVGSWGVLGFSVAMEAFDELQSINVPWSQEFSGVLRVWT